VAGATGRHGLPGSPPKLVGGHPLPPWTPRDILLISSITNAVLIVVIPLVLRATSGATLVDLGFGTHDLRRNVLRGLAACPLVAPGCYLLMAILSRFWPGEHVLVQMLSRAMTPSLLALAVVSAVVLAPILEELLFRGILLGWLETTVERWADRSPVPPPGDGEGVPLPLETVRREPGPMPAVVTSALFALMHRGQGAAPIPLFLLALVLAALARRTGSLWAPITLHAAFNGLSTLLLVLGLATDEPELPERVVPPPTAQLAVAGCSTKEESRNLVGFLLGESMRVD
jgi:membrane protease YdiL (CAAX protease family)